MGHANKIGDILNLLKPKGSSPKHPDRTRHSHSKILSRFWGSFPVVKLSRSEVLKITPPNTEVKKEWSYNSAPHICLNGVDRDKIYIFTLILR